MPMLETLFDTKKVPAERVDLVVDSDVHEDLKAKTLDPEEIELDLLEARFKKGTTLTIFHQPFSLKKAELQATAWIREAGWSTSIFDSSSTLETPDGKRLTELELTGRFGISVERELPVSPLALTASGGLSGEMGYRFLWPFHVKEGSTWFHALAGLVRNTRLPHNLELTKLPEGAALEIDAWINLRLGLQARFGKELEIDEIVRLFDDLAPEIQAHVRFSFEASLGWSLYEEMRLTVARAAVLNDGWVRVRLERTSERRLSASAVMSLQVEYDLGTNQLEELLNRSLGLVSTSSVVETFQEVHELLEDGGWTAVRKKLSSEAADWLTEYLGDRTWHEWTDGSARVRELTGLAAEVVDAFDGLDDRVRSLWEELLSRADLEDDSPAVQALQRIAALEPDLLDPEKLLSQDFREALPLLEILGGKSLEDLLVAGLQGVQQAATEARDLAREALSLREEVPTKVTDRLDELLHRNGIPRVVDFLRQVDSVDELKQRVDDEVRVPIERLVSRLLGKAFDEIGAGDLERIQRWADDVADVLAQAEAWDEKIRSALGKLEGELGFSVTLEMERLTRRTALVDLEVDPSSDRAVRAVEAGLRKADAREILDGLPEPGAGDPEDLPYQLRESVFSVRRTRTGMASTLLSVAGLSFLQQSVGRRIEESTVRLTQDGATFRRTGAYRAGYLRTEEGHDADSFTAGVWLSARGSAESSGKDLSAPYDELSSGLELVTRRDDPKTTGTEISALETLLRHLGFQKAPDAPALPDVSSPTRTRFALRLHLPEGAVDAYLAELEGGKKKAEAGWNPDFRNAAYRWYSDRLVSRTMFDRPDIRLGDALAAFVASDLFAEHGLAGARDLESWAVQQGAVRLHGPDFSAKLRLVDSIDRRWTPDARSLSILAASRGLGLKQHRKLETVHRTVISDRKPADLQELLRRAGKAFQASWVTAWPNPGFGFWLALARIHRLDPQALTEATGVASLRWRHEGATEWSGPVQWTLRRGIGIPAGPLHGVFPIA